MPVPWLGARYRYLSLRLQLPESVRGDNWELGHLPAVALAEARAADWDIGFDGLLRLPDGLG